MVNKIRKEEEESTTTEGKEQIRSNPARGLVSKKQLPARQLLRIGNIVFTDSLPEQDLFDALHALPSPLESPNQPALWTTEASEIKIGLQTEMLRNVIESASPSQVVEVLQTFSERGEWLKSYLLAGEIYRLILEEDGELSSEELSIVRHISTKAYDLLQGDVDQEAFSVEQGEFAVSDSSPLGTHNLQDCLGLFLFQPETNTMALAHIDGATRIRSLTPMVQALSGGQIQATLIGARFTAEEDGFLSHSARSNLSEVIAFLQDKNVSISHAEIGEHVNLLATAAVGDPKTGAVRRAFPGKTRATRELATAVAWNGSFGATSTVRGRDLIQVPLSQDFVFDGDIGRAQKIFSTEDFEEKSLYKRLIQDVEPDDVRPATRRAPTVIELYLRAYEQFQRIVH